jgi:hypothetical protein
MFRCQVYTVKKCSEYLAEIGLTLDELPLPLGYWSTVRNMFRCLVYTVKKCSEYLAEIGQTRDELSLPLLYWSTVRNMFSCLVYTVKNMFTIPGRYWTNNR